jgi:hypothetical protein
MKTHKDVCLCARTQVESTKLLKWILHRGLHYNLTRELNFGSCWSNTASILYKLKNDVFFPLKTRHIEQETGTWRKSTTWDFRFSRRRVWSLESSGT